MSEYCEAEVTIGHETVHCTLTIDKHGGFHEDDCFGGWPPCKYCGGLDMHSMKCPHPEESCSSYSWSVVRWRDGDKPTVKCGAFRGKLVDARTIE